MSNYQDFDDFYNDAWMAVDRFFEGISVERDMPNLLNCKNEEEVREFASDYANGVDWFSSVFFNDDTEAVDLPEELKEKYIAKVRKLCEYQCILIWEIELEDELEDEPDERTPATTNKKGEHQIKAEPKRVNIVWGDTDLPDEAEYFITEKLELYWKELSAYYDHSSDFAPVIESFWFSMPYVLSGYHTTDSLRMACENLHPEVDFDSEFQTSEPGVYGRYQERFGYDYQEWLEKYKHDELEKELSKRGYTLHKQ